MKIISITKNEPEGRTVNLGGKDYFFAPTASGLNVCEVVDPAHIERFLSIPEGYWSGEAVAPNKPAIVKDPPAPEPIEGTDAPTMAAAKPAAGDFNGLTRKQLEAAYTKKFGRKPNPRAKDETLLASLQG